jgi:chromate transporter
MFFSKAALVTFGGAYAVLPYVAQQAVGHYGWLSHADMATGLGFAETTPGPLIMVLQFVGFLGGWNHPGSLAPWQAATLGALITTWATFLPCFLFIFLGGPHVEGIRQQPRLGAALAAITAAVVGVILNLGVLLARDALFPHWRSDGFSFAGLDWFVLIAAAAAFLLLQRWKISFPKVLLACALVRLGLWASGVC